MRTSECEENIEEVNESPQSENSGEVVNESKILAETSTDTINTPKFNQLKVEICAGCHCSNRELTQEIVNHSDFCCYCQPSGHVICCAPKSLENKFLTHSTLKFEKKLTAVASSDYDQLFDTLKNTPALNQEPKDYSDSDSDVQIIDDSVESAGTGLFEQQPHLTSRVTKTYSKTNHRTSSGRVIKKPKPFNKKSLKENLVNNKKTVIPKGTKRKNSEEATAKTDLFPIAFVACDSEATEDKENLQLSQLDSGENLNNKKIIKSKESAKRRKIETGIDTNNKKENMSTYDYRGLGEAHLDPTGYYTTKITSIPTEDQQNTTNTTTQNLLDSNKTIATLCNIGNSCYLNSVVYTLRFAPLFLHKLHHLIEDMATIHVKLNPTKHKSSSLGRNVSLWQGHNGRSWSSKDLASIGSITGSDSMPKNNRLIVTEKLHELYQSLHKNESSLNTEPLHAGPFLQAIQDVCSIFEGNQQQDAHECLMCILDSIRETCDTLATAIIENPEQLLSEYGLGSLIEESRGDDGQVQQQQVQQSHQTSSNSSKNALKFFSRKSKRKKSDDDNVGAGAIVSGKPPQAPDSPVRDKDGQSTTTGIIQQDGNGDTPSAATSPTSTLDTKFNSRNMILKALAGDADISDKEKLKENVCKLLGLNFFCEDFEGVTVSSIKCLTCESVKTLKEKMIDISVPISGHENPDLMNNPQIFFQNSCITKEYFRGENKYRCETCFGYTEATRSISYEILPRLLVIHLKRFSGGMEKINSYIPTPFTLKCFCNRCCNLPDDKKLHIYKLYSVITHVGATMSVGHYVAYTCALDIQNEYRICTNDRTKIATLVHANSNGNNNVNGDGTASSRSSNSSLTTAGGGSNGTDKGSRSLKKLFCIAKKASSSSDLKNINAKAVNGISKVVVNGLEKLNLGINNSTNSSSSNNGTALSCQGLKCCGIHVKNSKLMCNNGTFVSYLNGAHVNGNGTNGSTSDMDSLAPSTTTKPSSSDISIASTNSSPGIGTATHLTDDDINSVKTIGTLASNISQEHWYMCDDDKIKVMGQQQFEDYLSPNRKNMITPYLLFYARFDANPT